MASSASSSASAAASNPATSSTSSALAKRPLPSDLSLMPPPPRPKRIKRPQKVLDEDTYTSALSHIIARDFFPGLLESESQQEYLDALDAGDDEWIDEAERKVREVMSTPRYGRGRRGVSMTPLRTMAAETPRAWSGDTPANATRASSATPLRQSDTTKQVNDLQANKEDEVDLSLGLTAFQAKYTSEDNESFYKVLDKQNVSRADKYRWMWNGNKIPSARQIAQAARDQKLLRASQRVATTPTNHDRQDSSQAVVLRPSQDLDARPASITVKPTANPRNNLMFHAADDVADTHPHLTTVADAAQARSKAPPKSVSYTSTRLQTALNAEDDSDSASVPESPSLSAIDAAISGHPRHRPTSTAAPSDISGNETPKVNGYGYVDAEPTPSELGIPPSPPPRQKRSHKDRADLLAEMIEAGRGGSSGAGEADSSSGVNPFTIHGSSKRESLHHRMVDKQLASKRASAPRVAALQAGAAGGTGRTPTPRFLSAPKTPATPMAARAGQHRGNLTPAAQQLYDKVGRTPVRVGGGGAFDFEKAAGRSSGAGRERRLRSESATPVRARKTA